MVSDVLLTQKWHCHCASGLSDFSAERLKAVICNALPALRDLSGDERLRRWVRPCRLLEGSALSGEVPCAYFLVGSQQSRLLAAGIICSSLEVTLVLLSGEPEARAALVEHLGEGFRATLQPLRLAPWRLSMAMAYGVALVRSDDPPESSLELRLEGGVVLEFQASVLAGLPVAEQVDEIAGRQTFYRLCQIAVSQVLAMPYEQLQLQGIAFSRTFSLDHGGVLELRSEKAALTIPYMLLSIAEELVLGMAAPQLEEASLQE